MPDNKLINTKTIVTKSNSDISIFTYYLNNVKSLLVFISDKLQNIGGKLFKENELGVTNNGYGDVSFLINNKGELIVQHDTDKTFSINSNGELIMEEII